MVMHFPRMVVAELQAVFGRWSGRAALILALLIPFAAAGAKIGLESQATEASFNGMPIQQMLDLSAVGVLDWSLTARNAFLLPALLVLATAASVSGELRDNTLRAVLSRPVSRASVLLAKLAALSVLSLSTLGLSFLPGLIAGVSLYGMPEDATFGAIGLGFAASWLSDLGLVAMTLLISVFLRNVGGVVVLLILYLMIDKAVGLMLTGLGVLGVEGVATMQAYLPGNALACWEGWNAADGWDASQFGGLALLFLLTLGISIIRFQRMDVP
ncbi:MAG: ABC transporter permease [Myxococcota bacterium]|nr:ABC transporter permease [Myxococcota bacterium]